MFTPIDIERNNHTNVTLFDTHDITFNRDQDNNVEIVIHPCNIGKATVRFAKEPYICTITLKKNDIYEDKTFDIDLGDESDWGEIDTTDPKHPLFGNDVDGYAEIKSVEVDGKKMKLEDFSRDVNDFIIYYEG